MLMISQVLQSWCLTMSNDNTIPMLQLQAIECISGNINIDLECAKVMLMDVRDNFFSLDVEKMAQDHCFKLLCDYHEYFVKAGIVMDYLLNLEKSAAELQEFYTTEWDKTKNSIA